VISGNLEVLLVADSALDVEIRNTSYLKEM